MRSVRAQAEIMSNHYHPGEEGYKSNVRLEFSFLLTEFDFVETKCFVKTTLSEKILAPYSIEFIKKNTFVHMNAIGYGSPLGVFVGRYNHLQEVKDIFPLEDIISFRNPKMLESGFPDRQDPKGNLIYSAMALRNCAEDFLKGDSSDLPNLKRHIHKLDVNDEARYVHLMERKATKAYRSGKYRKVMKLLQPFREKLGSAGISLLMDSQARLDSSNRHE